MEIVKTTLFYSYNVLITLGLLLFCFQKAQSTIQKIKYKRHKNFVWILLVIHFAFAILSFVFSLNNNADSVLYFKDAFNGTGWFSLFTVGTGFVKFLVYPLIKLGLTYFNVFFVFSIAGFLGFLKLYRLLLKNLSKKNKTLPKATYILFLLPSFHFYTSAIGKDALVFFLLTYVFYEVNKKRMNYKKLSISLLFIALIRPHVFIIVVFSYLIVIYFSNKVTMKAKLIIVGIGVSLIFLGKGPIERKLNIDNLFSKANIELVLERISGYGKRKDMGGSVVDASEFSLPKKMFMFSYAPIFWKANSAFKYIVSIENLIMLLILINFLFKNKKWVIFKASDLYIKLMLLYVFLMWTTSSMRLYNLGLATRQKYMYIPFLYFTIFYFLLLKNKKAKYK